MATAMRHQSGAHTPGAIGARVGMAIPLGRHEAAKL